MPWEETSPMKERVRFIKSHRSGLYSMTELCEQFGVSRKTGYKWVQRFEERGVLGLEDRSRAPKANPNRMSDRMAGAVIEARRLHPTWGPKKLVAWLQSRWPDEQWPAASSAGELLRREGLVKPRRRVRRRSLHPGKPRIRAERPNDVWTADFKGQFRTRDWDWCYPLTVADLRSRYLLEVKALDGTDGDGVRPVFERVFREAGLPHMLLTDNGPPFVAPRGLLGLTRLSVWWMRLGIQPVRTEPGHPEQNGVHERMHRTLKAETGKPPSGNRSAQQRRFNRFRHIYNDERPHESLGQKPPATVWQKSPRPFPQRLPDPEYPEHFLKRFVSTSGCFVLQHKPIYLSTALADQWIGLDEVDDGIWSIHLGESALARFDEELREIHV